MDEHERALRLALFKVAEKITRDMVVSIDWGAVLQLTQEYAETTMATPEAEILPENEREKIPLDTARITVQLLRERHIVGGLTPLVMMLVWRCVSYSTPIRYRERDPANNIRLDKKAIENVEASLLRGWAAYWEHFEGELQRDSRGAASKWSAVTVMNAINHASPHVPAARWSYGAVAERITRDMGLDPPLTGDALRKLITRHNARRLWKEWSVAKQRGHKK